MAPQHQHNHHNHKRNHTGLTVPPSLLPDPPTLFSAGTTSPKPPKPAPVKSTTTPKSQQQQQSQSRSTLQTHARLLQLIHYRNKNQHRRAHWYRSFATFRREVLRVCTLLQLPLDTSSSTPISKSDLIHIQESLDPNKDENENENEYDTKKLPLKTRQRLFNAKIHNAVNSRVQYWVQHDLVAKWYAAFTHVVSTTQFSALGMCLVACLARICKVVGITGFLQQGGFVFEEDDVKVGDDLIGKVVGDSRVLEDREEQESEENEDMGNGKEKGKEGGIDLGVKVERDKIDNNSSQIPSTKDLNLKRQRREENDDTANITASNENEKQPTPIPKKKKKKKKRNKEEEGGDAIDDLFAGLV